MTTKSKIAIVILSLLAMSFLGMAVVLQRNTLVRWWLPATVCMIPAIALGLRSANATRKLTNVKSKFINITTATTLLFSIFLGAFYTANYYASDHKSVVECQAVIVKKHREEHYHVRRLSRNRSVRGQKYDVYYISFSLPDNTVKQTEVSAGDYIRFRKGQQLKLQVEKGFFGVPVIKNLRFPVRKPINQRQH